jgi:hypothetical protein
MSPSDRTVTVSDWIGGHEELIGLYINTGIGAERKRNSEI